MADDFTPTQKQQLLNLQDQLKSWQAVLTNPNSTPEEKQEVLKDVKEAKNVYGDISGARKAFNLYSKLSQTSDAAETAEPSEASEIVEGLAEVGEGLEDLAPLLLL